MFLHSANTSPSPGCLVVGVRYFTVVFAVVKVRARLGVRARARMRVGVKVRARVRVRVKVLTTRQHALHPHLVALSWALATSRWSLLW